MLANGVDQLVANGVGAIVFDDRTDKGAVAARFHISDGSGQERQPAARRVGAGLDLLLDLPPDPGGEAPVRSARASVNRDSEVRAADMVVRGAARLRRYNGEGHGKFSRIRSMSSSESSLVRPARR